MKISNKKMAIMAENRNKSKKSIRNEININGVNNQYRK